MSQAKFKFLVAELCRKMANYESEQNYWDAAQGQNQKQDFHFEMPEQFGGEELWVTFKRLVNVISLNIPDRAFQSFDPTFQPQASPAQGLYANVPPNQNFGGSFLDPSQSASMLSGPSEFGQENAYSGNSFDDEPPLLEGKNIISIEIRTENWKFPISIQNWVSIHST